MVPPVLMTSTRASAAEEEAGEVARHSSELQLDRVLLRDSCGCDRARPRAFGVCSAMMTREVLMK